MAYFHIDLSAIPKTGWTVFQANLLAAVHACPDDPLREREARYKDHMAGYTLALARVNGTVRMPTNQEAEERLQQRRDRTKARLTEAAYDPTAYNIQAPTNEAFEIWLKTAGHRYTRFTVPHPCPLCTEGPTNETVYAMVAKEIAMLRSEDKPVPGALLQKSAKLRASLRIYRVHVQQLEECRKAAKKAEDDLQPGTAMVIRDFVNHHDHSGSHVKCLHWVLMWRDTMGGPIKRLKLRHYCSHKPSMSTDSYFQADVTDFHLNESNPHCPLLFKSFHTVIFVGDHGPHFSSHETMHNESTILRRYGKKIICMFFASYHAYSRADGAGAEDSTGLRSDLVSGFPRIGSPAMTEMTNDSNDHSSWAYDFPQINRGENVFPRAANFKATDRAKWIRKWTEVTYIHPDTSGAHDGILQYRLVTGQGEWQWTDLVAKTRDDDHMMCDRCSTVAQEATFHTQKECPAPQYIHDLPVYRDLQPDPNRIQGEQKEAGKQRGKGKTTTFPCKFVTCDHYLNKRKAFRQAANANRHMRLEHNPTDEEFDGMAYPDGEQDVPVSHEAPEASKGNKRKKPAEKKQNTPPNRSKPAKRHNTEESGSDAKDSGQGGDEDSGGNSEHNSTDSSDSDEQDNDADNLVPGERQYEVEMIHRHRLLKSGALTYEVEWVGYAKHTWEPPSGLTAISRNTYHKEFDRREAAAKLLEVEPSQRRRGRSNANAPESTIPHATQVTDLAEKFEEEGFGYYVAYEKAQSILGVG